MWHVGTEEKFFSEFWWENLKERDSLEDLDLDKGIGNLIPLQAYGAQRVLEGF
jgi:hypothetical protein